MSSGALFEQMQGRRWRQSDFRVVTTLSLVFSSQLHYFWCKKGRTIAAFANSFHPLVCHLWEAKEKKSKDFSGTLGVKKNYRVILKRASCRVFFLSGFLSDFLFSLKALNIPSDRRWLTLSPPFRFFKTAWRGVLIFSLEDQKRSSVSSAQ